MHPAFVAGGAAPVRVGVIALDGEGVARVACPMLVAGQEMSHKVQGRSGRIHKEEFLLSRRMAGAGDARKAL